MISPQTVKPSKPVNASSSPIPFYGNSSNRAYDIISKIAYLVGVQKQHFEHDYATPLLILYDKLNENKPARIIRSFCKIRNALMKHYRRIDREMQYELKKPRHAA